MKREFLNLDITLGPLHYRLQAHDSWAAELLGRLPRQIACRTFSGPADRHLHLVTQAIRQDNAEDFKAGILPPDLAAIVSKKLPSEDWQITGNDTMYLTWRHAGTSQVFWTRSSDATNPSLPFHLPLDLLLHDIVQLGGGIIHGGLAVYRDQGILITAPSGGGKTTALATIPEDWQLKSDDAALIWPVANNTFMVSPLPTWSVLCGVNTQPEQISKWQVDSSYPLQMIVLLKKADTFAFIPTQPVDAVFPLYQACSEYPTVILGRGPYRGDLFRAAARLAQSVPCHSLQLPRKGNFWPRLKEELPHGRC